MQFIFDTDCGMDDFLALLFLKRSGFRPTAVTLCHGNVSMIAARAQASLLFDRKILFDGCLGPLVCRSDKEVECWAGHGVDGLGGERAQIEALLQAEAKGQTPQQQQEDHRQVRQSAAVRIAEICASAEEGGVVLLALGPLTNIALALLLDATALKRAIGRVVVMGGALHGKVQDVKWLLFCLTRRVTKGNSGLASEFNFAADPEAASNVLRAFGARVELVPWEATLEVAKAGNSFVLCCWV
jgi:purine nucleosidase